MSLPLAGPECFRDLKKDYGQAAMTENVKNVVLL